MDTRLFLWINRLARRTGWLHEPLTLFAKYGIVLFAALLVVCVLQGRRNHRAREIAGSIWAAGAALAALGIGQLIGGAVGRARPYTAISGIHPLIARTTDFSFPSDHATAAGAVAVGLLLTNRRWGIVAGVLAAVMAFARVYVGAHYPGDVVAGLVLGGVVAAAGWGVVVPPLVKLVEWLRRSKLRVLVDDGTSTQGSDPAAG